MGMATGVSVRVEAPPSMAGRILWLAIAAALVALSVTLLPRPDWAELSAHQAASAWPTTEATILDVELERRSVATMGGSTQNLVLTGAYRYEVDGSEHEGRSITLRQPANMPERHIQTLYTRLNFARLTGRPIAVHYDPAMPAHAFVDISVDLRRHLWPALGSLALLVAAASAAGTALRSRH